VMGEREKLAPVEYQRTHKSNVISKTDFFASLPESQTNGMDVSSFKSHSDVTHVSLTWAALLTSRTDGNRGLEVEAWRVWHVYVLGTSKSGPGFWGISRSL
jgi:hypothetical protein